MYTSMDATGSSCMMCRSRTNEGDHPRRKSITLPHVLFARRSRSTIFNVNVEIIVVIFVCLQFTLKYANAYPDSNRIGKPKIIRDRTKDKILHIGGIFPMTGSWAGGKGCRPAIEMALEDINKEPDILPGYTLKMVANDSQVSASSR